MTTSTDTLQNVCDLARVWETTAADMRADAERYRQNGNFPMMLTCNVMADARENNARQLRGTIER